MLARVVKDVSNPSRSSTPHHLHYFFSPCASLKKRTATLYYSFTIMSMNVFTGLLSDTRSLERLVLQDGVGTSIVISSCWFLNLRSLVNPRLYLTIILPFPGLSINSLQTHPVHSVFTFLTFLPFKPLQPFVLSKGVENIGFEPMTPCLQSRCSSQLS